MSSLLASAVTFAGMHLLPSTPLRPKAVAVMGNGLYLAVFSLVSLASLYWMTEAFKAAPYGEKLWVMSAEWLWVKATVVLFALFLIVAGTVTPNPSLPGADKVLLSSNASRGVFAITRHPMMWGIALWAAAHLVTQATWRGIFFFGAFAGTALFGAWLQDRRKRATLGRPWAAFAEKTSFFPFAAVAEGRATLSFATLGLRPLLFAVALWAAMLLFHPALFGAHPLPLAV